MSRSTTESEIRKTIQNLKAIEKKATGSKQSAKDFLYKTGLYTKNGNLKRVVS